MTGTIDPNLAHRHEALAVRLDALLKELSPIARKRPEGCVPPAVAESAGAILFEARPFGVTGALPEKGTTPPAETWAGLIAKLAEARARLETFETTRSLWDFGLQCRAWRIAGGDPLPIGRLRAAGKSQPVAPADQRRNDDLRKKLIQRIDAKIGAAYDRGYADATAGRPSSQA